MGASFDITGNLFSGVDLVYVFWYPFAEETCCWAQSCTFAGSLAISAVTWWWDSALMQRIVALSFQNHLVLIIKTFLVSSVIHDYFFHFWLYLNKNLSNFSFFTTEGQSKILWNMSWASSLNWTRSCPH